AVPALVCLEIEIVGVVRADALPQRADDALVMRARRANEAVVGDAERFPARVEARRDLVDELLWREPAPLRGLFDFLAVLVGAGEEPRVVAAHAVKARERVGDDRAERVTEVRDVVDVVDRR